MSDEDRNDDCLRSELRELADMWDDGFAADQACARELRKVLDDYS